MSMSIATAKASLKSAKNLVPSVSTDETITICGGGNGAHVTAGYLASKGYHVNVLTRKPSKWKKTISITTKGSSWEEKGTIRGNLTQVTSMPEQVIPQSTYIIIAAPANAHPDILTSIAPYIRKGTYLGALFAQGGFDWVCKANLGSDVFDSLGMLFGFQNIPWICKATTYGSEAKIIGPKKCLYLATYPIDFRTQMADSMEQLFDIPCQSVANFLTLTLTPSNQIIHPGRYYGIFHDWDGKKTYTKKELADRKGLTLYADMDEFSAEQMAMLDNELQQVKLALLQRFPALDLSDVIPLGERVIKHYGEDVSDRSSLKSIFATNLGYAGCATPLVEVSKDQYQPAINSRLFWEDVPYGLCILKNMAEMLGNFPTPRIDFMIRWHQQFMGVKFICDDNQLNPQELWRTGAPNKYGIHRLKDLVQTSMTSEMQEYAHPRARL